MSEWKPARCPKCQSFEVILEEIWTSSVTLVQRKDGTLEQPLFNLEPGNPTGVILATCEKCDHHWKLRGWRQFPSDGIQEQS
jgi:hypothetical protein